MQQAVKLATVTGVAIMSESMLDGHDLRAVLKEAVVQALHEEREFLHGIFAEVVEDVALVEAIRQGREGGHIPRDEVMRVLDGSQG